MRASTPHSTARCAFRLLGPLQVAVGGRGVEIRSARQRALLARLLLAQGQVVSVDTLVADVWGGEPPNSVRTQVHICVAGLRKLLRDAGCRGEVISTVAPGYRIDPDDHRVDAAAFAALAEEGYRLARAGRAGPAVERLREALALWRGPALGGVDTEFAEAEAARLAEQRMLAAEQLMALRLQLGEDRSLIAELDSLVRQNPLRERLRGSLMLARYRSGQRAAALRTYREGRSLIVAELGLEPGVELRALHDLVLHDREGGADGGPTPPARWADHPVPAQLPPDNHVFTGREAELRRLDGALAAAEDGRPGPVRFVVGGPGTGKTALVVHWAHRAARHFPDGQLFVNLREAETGDAAGTAARVLRRFLRGLGVAPERLPAAPEECAVLYRSMLAGRRLLVVLDDVTLPDRILPLLPGDGPSRVVATGPELVLDSGSAAGLRLGALGTDEAVAVLAAIAGPERILGDRRSAERLAALCGGLPVALRAAGARLAGRPHWSALDLVERLADGRRRLDVLGHDANGVRACFDRAVAALSADVAESYRRLGAAGTAPFDLRTGVRLLRLGPSDAEEALERLVDRNLLEVEGRDADRMLRYRFPPLLGLHAAESAAPGRAAGLRGPARQGVLPVPSARLALVAAPGARTNRRHRADADLSGS
ncbi:BTAD domain-containing putative transcriptional regulator [Kitasatospora sp. NPDC048545]|uniref:AfsR/SARP family transcriptional regulator n=1 Tax=Kitasatospora sp. NPDC048545 TaxID=3157208 RepID=UPI0033C1D80D